MSALEGDVDVPAVGPVDKRVLLAVGGAAAAFVAWRWYQARSATGYDPEAPVDPGMEDPGILPAVAGAVRPDNDYGLPGGDPSTGSFGFTGKTNSQWSQYAINQLVQSERWSYTDIAEALGAYTAKRPLTSSQQTIVQAAIAVAGYPPEGSLVIVPGGDTPITVAPTGVKVTSTTTTTAALSWSPVAGASGYRLYRSGVSEVVGVANGTTGTVGGLSPNTSYSFQVAAFTGSGKVGPKSASASGKTKGVVLKAPTGVRVTNVKATSATVTWGGVSGADYYRIYVNGHQRGSADGGLRAYTITGLAKKTKYSVKVAADTTKSTPGPASSSVTFTTKTK